MRRKIVCLLLILAGLTPWLTNAAAIDPLDRVWRDAAGGWYSVLVDEDGVLTVHQAASGRYFRYELAGDKARPQAGSPDLILSGKTLQFGETRLVPWSGHSEWFDFEHGGLRFHGVLTLPEGDGPFPLVVDAHGSGRAAATGSDWAASWYAQAGYATLVFDKRGTGQSGGEYTHDFELLAGDLLAALQAATADARIATDRTGLAGYSQGVYVSTLAASRSNQVAFVIAGFGMTESPLMEDMLETRLHFESHYAALDWADFERLVSACQQAFALHHDDRWAEVSALRKRWRDRIDADHLSGTLTGDGCLRWGPTALKLFGRKRLPPGLHWDYDPQPIMSSLKQPVLWQFGSDDVAAPSASSIALTRRWAAAGKPMTVHVYEGAGHGIYRQGIDELGHSYRYKDPRYIADLVQWLRERAQPRSE